ncbi:MAG: hypothetical protein AAGA95_15080 [Pseudomonadota bacterium]
MNTVIDAHATLDLPAGRTLVEFVEGNPDGIDRLEALRDLGLQDVVNALTMPSLAATRMSIRSRIFCEASQERGGRFGIGIVGTPIEAFYEASYGSTEETESVFEIEIERRPLNSKPGIPGETETG